MAERRKLGLIFIACAIAAIAIVGGALWRVTRDGGGGPAGNEAVITIVFALSGLLAALAFLWARIDLRVLSPLERLQRELDTILQCTPDRPVDLAAAGALGPLITRIDRLATRADAARRDVASSVAAATDRLADERERLAAVLRDLSEGVIVCTTDHRVLLFNDAARRTLAAEERLGLGRSVFDALCEEALGQAFSRLSRDSGDPYRPVETEIEARATGERRAARMAAVVDLGGTVEGYVLSFAGTVAAETTPRSAPLPPRPVFYDFDLFRPRAREAKGGERPLAAVDFIVFDTETTGLRPDEGDAIVQIGAVRVADGRVLANETFETLVNPGRSIPPSSTRFHGITDEMVAGAPAVIEAVARFRRFAGDAVLVAQNAAFDMKFLRLRETEADVVFDAPVLDTMLLSFFLHPGEGDHTLDGLAARYGVDVAGRHTALGDAMVTAVILCRMIPLLAASDVTSLDEALAVARRMATRFGPG